MRCVGNVIVMMATMSLSLGDGVNANDEEITYIQ